MASDVRKVFENEKYMNDAASSVFFNLLTVSKRKKDHVWNVSKCTVPKKSLSMKTELNASKGFWDVVEPNSQIKPQKEIDGNKNMYVASMDIMTVVGLKFEKPQKEIDEKKEMYVASMDIMTERNQQNPENISAVRTVSNSKKITEIKSEMSHSESDISVNKTSVYSDQMIQRSSVENNIDFESKNSRDLNKKDEYRANSFLDSYDGTRHVTEIDQISHKIAKSKDVCEEYTSKAAEVLQKSKLLDENKANFEMKQHELIDEKKDVCVASMNIKTKRNHQTSENVSKNSKDGYLTNPLSMPVSNRGTKHITEIDEMNFRIFVSEDLCGEYTLKTSCKSTEVLQRIGENKLKSDGSKDFSKNLEYETRSRNKCDDFQDWCLRRRTDYLSSPKKLQVNVSARANESKGTSPVLQNLSTIELVDHDNNKLGQNLSSRERKQQIAANDSCRNEFVGHDNNKFGQILTSRERKQQIATNDSPRKKIVDQINIDKMAQIKPSKQRKRHNSANSYTNVKERSLSISKIYSGPEKHSKTENSEACECEDIAQTMLSITIMKDEKYYEIMTVVRDFSRMKKNFPKFSELLPDVDCEEREFDFSADAVKVVLGFMFNPSYNFSAIQNEMLAVEILALTQAWEITKYQNAFHKYFLQNILTKGNASKIYSLASQFGLNKIKDACKDFVKDGYSMKYRQKKCSVTITTYIEPLEFCLPLDSVKDQLSESFNRTVVNEIFFESISDCYIIKGLQIQLNVDKLDKSSNYSKLEMYYSAKNITEKIEICEQKAQKHLGSTIFLYFNKKLVIKPNQKGKIEVYTDIKPCLCYTFQKETLVENSSKGKFNLTLKSNYKIMNSDLKVFFIGKLLYHVKPSAS